MRLLIVDDEVRQVKALTAIIHRIKPQYDIKVAYDGEEAWQFIQSEPIEAVISDIRMPMMDGIGLIQRIQAKKPNIKVALVSGYSEFEYAQKAIRNNVVEYLIKPIGYLNILEILSKFESLLEKDREEALLHKLWIDKQCNQLIHGRILPSEGVPALGAWIPTNGPGYLCLIKHLDEVEDQKNVNSERYKSEINRSLKGMGTVRIFTDDTNPCHLVAMLWLTEAHGLSHVHIQLRLRNKLEEHLLTQFPDAIIGISAARDSLVKEAHIAYQEALSAAGSYFYREEHILFFDSYSQHKAAKSNRGIVLDSDSFVNLVYAKDRMGVMNTINGWFDHVHQLTNIDPANLKRKLIHFIAAVNEQLKIYSTPGAKDDQLFNITTDVENSATVSELRIRLKGWISDWMERLEMVELDKNYFIIERCKVYLAKHFMEDISLERTADMFHFHPSYFSVLFKQKTGVNFSDYILNLRIEHARKILEQSDRKIVEVSQEVGFRNSAYFIKMFKRKTGLSPNRYRQLARNEHLV